MPGYCNAGCRHRRVDERLSFALTPTLASGQSTNTLSLFTMDFSQIIDWLLHLDVKLVELVREYGTWTYAILFAIVFSETGLVVTPFLPGDSLLFAAGAIAAKGALNVWIIMAVLLVAAILGDTVNYHVGHYIGPKVFREDRQSRWLKKKHLDRTHAFFEKYGGKTIIIARFVPIVRTFAPFVAGVGAMTYPKFLFYNVLGGVLWVVSLTLAGYWFGRIPWVEKNFEIVVLAIIAISLLPVAIEFINGWRKSRNRTVTASASDLGSEPLAEAAVGDAKGERR
jgi:membrane-associated protein